MLILVRHGRTELNRRGCLQGRLDTDLDEHGERQAAAVARYLAERYGVDEVVASPLRRAQQTAAAFAIPVTTDERWIELSYGRYEGQELRSVPAEVWQRWRTDVDFALEGGEALSALDRRVREACIDLAERASERNVVVVSHVSPLKAASAWALGVDISISWSCHLDHAAICRIGLRRTRIDEPVTPILESFNEAP